MTPVRIWDLPTRLFHWLLAVCIVALVITGNVGGNAMYWHFRLGYAVMSLLVFRLVWGFIGGHWSRFDRFLYRPTHLLRYLRGQGDARDDVGHSPTGALSVFALLAIVWAQVLAGLMADDEIATSGPWVAWVNSEASSMATSFHTEVGKLLLIAWVVVHIGAVMIYRLRGNRTMLRAMVTGDKPLPPHTPASRDGFPQRMGALLVWAAACVLVYVLVEWAPRNVS